MAPDDSTGVSITVAMKCHCNERFLFIAFFFKKASFKAPSLKMLSFETLSLMTAFLKHLF